MTALQDGFGGVGLDVEFGGFGAEAVDEFRNFDRARRAAHGIGGHEGGERFDGFWREAAGEAAHGTVGHHFGLEHVIEDEREDAFAEVKRRADAFEEIFGEWDGGGFVAGGTDAVGRDDGGGGFAEV